MCGCEECEAAAESMSVDDIREHRGCQRRGYSATVRHWAHIYTSQIAQGYLDPTDYDLRYLQVAMIGDQVTNRAQADRLNAIGND